MLVIRRRAGESVVIGGDVEVEVLEISPTRVKLGIRAPESVEISRKEVGYVAGENKSAAAEIPFELLAPVLALLDSRPAEQKDSAPPRESV